MVDAKEDSGRGGGEGGRKRMAAPGRAGSMGGGEELREWGRGGNRTLTMVLKSSLSGEAAMVLLQPLSIPLRGRGLQTLATGACVSSLGSGGAP